MHGPLNLKSGKYSHILTMTNTATMRNIVVMLMYDKLNVVGICGNEIQGEMVLILITKLNKYNTLFSRNSHYKFSSENSSGFRRVTNTNVTIKLKSTTHVSGKTLLHVSIQLFICYNMLSWNRVSLTKSLWRNIFSEREYRVLTEYFLGDKIEKM